MKKKIIGSICLVLGIIIVISSVTTYAYLYSSFSNDNTVTGEAYNFDVYLGIEAINIANKMVPLEDNLVTTMISKNNNKCIDNDGYQVCSLYKITVNNDGSLEDLYGYVKTEESTYTTTNLKYQIFDMHHSPVTDIMSISKTANGRVFFKNNNSSISVLLEPDTSIEYYLIVWIHETGNLQKDDEDKEFAGKIGFESLGGDRIEAKF